MLLAYFIAGCVNYLMVQTWLFFKGEEIAASVKNDFCFQLPSRYLKNQPKSHLKMKWHSRITH